MADSVDRVFVHALNTVKRIRSARPPPADRLKLYGLYKQSMEGDVEAVMERPRGDAQSMRGNGNIGRADGDSVRADQEKWDAWASQRGVSRTEAKRRYIETLVETMHRYASQTPDARELISELEFVWDQIKSNPPSSSSSSNSYPPLPGQPPPPISSNGSPRRSPSPPPVNTSSQLLPGAYPSPTSDEHGDNEAEDSDRRPRSLVHDGGGVVRIETPAPRDRRPDTHAKGAEDSGRAAEEEPKDPETPGPEVYVDAPDSQPDYDHDNVISTSAPSTSSSSSHIAPSSPSPSSRPHPTTTTSTPRPQMQPQQTPPLPAPPPPPPTTPPRRDLQTAAGALIAPFAAYMTKKSPKPPASTTSTANATAPTTAAAAATQKWQRRVEASLIKLTAELAALREQLEMQQQRSSSHNTGASSGSALTNPFRRSLSGLASGVDGGGASGAWEGKKRFTVRGVLVAALRGVLGAVGRVLVVDALAVGVLVVWMRWKGFGVEDLVEVWRRWVKGWREGRLVKSWEGGSLKRGVERMGEMARREGGAVRRGVGGLVSGVGSMSGVRFLPGSGSGSGTGRGRGRGG